MLVEEAIEELKRMNPKQELVVAIDEHENAATEYVPVDCIAQTTKHAVIEITY